MLAAPVVTDVATLKIADVPPSNLAHSIVVSPVIVKSFTLKSPPSRDVLELASFVHVVGI
jgi:hypothetical protein